MLTSHRFTLPVALLTAILTFGLCANFSRLAFAQGGDTGWGTTQPTTQPTQPTTTQPTPQPTQPIQPTQPPQPTSSPALTGDWSFAPLNGKFGLGFFGYLNIGISIGAVSFRYHLAQEMVVEGLFGLAIRSTGGTGSSTEFDFLLGGSFFYYFAQGDHARLGFGGRLFLGFTNDFGGAAVGGSAHFEIEIPLQFEYFFSRNFSMFVQVSVTFHIVGSTVLFPGPLAGAGGNTGFSIIVGQGAVLGAAGFTYWFS